MDIPRNLGASINTVLYVSLTGLQSTNLTPDSRHQSVSCPSLSDMPVQIEFPKSYGSSFISVPKVLSIQFSRQLTPNQCK